MNKPWEMQNFTLEHRQREAKRLMDKYSDRVPVIVERFDKSKIQDIDKHKFLVPSDQTVGQMVYVIRRRIKLSPEKAIFVFVNNVLPPTAALISEIYQTHKNEDGFLYITYAGENVFGSANVDNQGRFANVDNQGRFANVM